ncbi:MAG: ATP-dependent zinc metalloprotease FtsH [Coprobacillus sp.]|nr:ATP-dependent zinc metalloprotease FtsH [Coprobacillus sp.]
MPENNQNNRNNNGNGSNDGQRQGGFSSSFIIVFIIIVVIIGLLIWFFVASSSSAVVLDTNTFVQYLMDGRITEITETPKEQTIVVIEGKYTETTTTTTSRSFVYRVSWETYYNEEFEYTYYPDSTTNVPATTDQTTISHLVLEKHNAGEIDYTVSDAYTSTFWESWGPTIIVMLVTILIFVWLFARMSRSMNASNNQAMQFNRSRARKETSSKVRFSDVAGCDEEKYEMEEIVSYLKEPKKYVKFGAKLPKGILLVGPPGCGKTLLAKAVAGEAGVPFYSVSGSDFVEMFVGVGAGRVRDMFKTAKQNAPCLVFIDEIDAVGRQRGAGLGGGNDEREQTLNQLLVEMDGFSDNSGIIVIAATNRDDVLDPALLRAGRFDRKITVSYPDRKGREEIFKVHSRNKQVSPDVDFEALSKRTVGFSGADIENIMNEAAILAVRENKECITLEMIDEAIDRRIAGPAKSSRALTEQERKTVAYHEAGHAVVGINCPYSDKVQKITIIPRGNTGGHVRMGPEEDRFILTKRELEARIAGYMGGRTSEEIFFDDISTGAENDIEVATQIARSMVTELGMSSLGPIQYESDTGSVFLGRDYTNTQKNFSTETALKIDEEIRKIIDEAHKQAYDILTEHKDQVILIANTLLENETITAEEIDELIATGHLKPKNKSGSSSPAPTEQPQVQLSPIAGEEFTINSTSAPSSYVPPLESGNEESEEKSETKKSSSAAKKPTSTSTAKKTTSSKSTSTKSSSTKTKKEETSEDEDTPKGDA